MLMWLANPDSNPQVNVLVTLYAYRELEKYVESYKSLKGLRTLEWKSHLGLVQVCKCYRQDSYI